MKTYEVYLSPLAELKLDLLLQYLELKWGRDPKVEKAWAKEARRCLEEFQQGNVKAITGEQFDKEVQEMKKRFSE